MAASVSVVCTDTDQLGQQVLELPLIDADS
jgi:hypothetical protein